jgi:MauM/NapG family ferredoxin protein
MGTLIDASGHVIKPKVKIIPNLKYLKYVLLIILLISSLFGVQLLGYVDPFSLLVRGLVFSFDPMLNYIVALFFDTIYTSGPVWLSNLSEPIYDGFKMFILPFKQSFFLLSLFSFFLILLIFLMELIGKRFWCRNLCPLGALLALISKISILKRIPIKVCKHCEVCSTDCRMKAFDENNVFQFEECNLCMDCLEYCPDQITTFKFALPKFNRPNDIKVDIKRRQLITSGAAGIAIPILLKTNALSKLSDDKVIRPPGALEETDFLATCVRCGECLKVCINNSLQPLTIIDGLENIFTPILVPRLGYCEFNCTLCSQVCPTGALEKINLEQKHSFVIGKAYFDKNRCLVYADKKACIVCEEHCPTFDKAIKFSEVNAIDFEGNKIVLKQPYVKEDLCIGCGICENVCPVNGSAAIKVVGKGRIKDNALNDGY